VLENSPSFDGANRAPGGLKANNHQEISGLICREPIPHFSL
jgi:hypothetical protein